MKNVMGFLRNKKVEFLGKVEVSACLGYFRWELDETNLGMGVSFGCGSDGISGLRPNFRPIYCC